MVSSAVKTAVAALLIPIGVVGITVGLLFPGPTCTQVVSDGEVVEENCHTDESLQNLAFLAMGGGLLFTVLGTGAVWKFADGRNQLVDVVSGVVLVGVGIFTTYLFGGWFWNLVTTPIAGVGASLAGFAVLVGLAAMGLAIAVTGGRALWNVVRTRRR